MNQQTSMFQTTRKQQTHGEIILDAIRGQWLHSADLVALTKTRNLQARISGLEAAGWTVERRPTTDYRDGVEYRAVNYTPQTKASPKQIHVKVPEGCPAGAIEQAKAEAARIMFAAAESARESLREPDLMDFFNLFRD